MQTRLLDWLRAININSINTVSLFFRVTTDCSPGHVKRALLTKVSTNDCRMLQAVYNWEQSIA